MKKLVTCVTSTRGTDLVRENILSVQKQDYPNIQHLLIVDGEDRHEKVREILDTEPKLHSSNLDVVYYPYATGKNRFNGHRQYAAATFLAEGEYIFWLDDDNTIEPEHVSSCMRVIESGKPWAFALRNIMAKDGSFICQDNCESLGNWPTCIDDKDFLVDMNCYFLPRTLAINVAPLMNVPARPAPPTMEIDRVMVKAMKDVMKLIPGHSGKYTVNYRMGGNELSVQPDFFLQGNEKMRAKYGGNYPWNPPLIEAGMNYIFREAK